MYLYVCIYEPEKDSNIMPSSELNEKYWLKLLYRIDRIVIHIETSTVFKLADRHVGSAAQTNSFEYVCIGCTLYLFNTSYAIRHIHYNDSKTIEYR